MLHSSKLVSDNNKCNNKVSWHVQTMPKIDQNATGEHFYHPKLFLPACYSHKQIDNLVATVISTFRAFQSKYLAQSCINQMKAQNRFFLIHRKQSDSKPKPLVFLLRNVMGPLLSNKLESLQIRILWLQTELTSTYGHLLNTY